MRNIIVLLAIFIVNVLPGYSQNTEADKTLIGAQVFIEPGQTEQETEQWFRVMSENGMNICRIRMFETYMHKPDGSWDFSLFDRAFRYAEKYNIKILGTFFPKTEKTDIGGWKFPATLAELEEFADYIKELVVHFRQFRSLYGWVLINEPGGGFRNSEFERRMRSDWDKNNPLPDFIDNGYPQLVNLNDYRFRMYLTSWMLNWIAGEVRKYDRNVHLHVNNHAMFSNFQEYDFPYWRNFLTSLGGSAHASWHFGQFSRREYALAMSANSEILRSGAGSLPWFMTELQGGNNTYSGNNPMCPTPEEIIQWLWIIIGTEGKGGIFWTLNPRSSGIESGEWALLDFGNQSTDRVEAIKKVSTCLKTFPEITGKAKKADPGIDLVYIRESQWAENVITRGVPAENDGRKTGLSDLLGYFQAFSELGISPNILEIGEYDFSGTDYSKRTMILANQIALSSDQAKKLGSFIRKGGTIIVDGLTGYFNEKMLNVMHTGFPLKESFGGEITEFRYLDTLKYFSLPGTSLPVPGSGWEGFIKPEAGSKILMKEGNNVLAASSAVGPGKVIWVPSLLGAAARKYGSGPLASWLKDIVMTDIPFSFQQHTENMLMKTLENSGGYITVVINKSREQREIPLEIREKSLKPTMIFSDHNGTINGNLVSIGPEETLVIRWK